MKSEKRTVKTKKYFLKDFSFNYGITFYEDEKNIANQELVKETIDYFNTGQGSRAFEPLEFLNLLYKQYKYVNDHYKDSEGVLIHLRNLPFNPLEKHILLGLLLKWYGGYPFNEGTDFNEDWRRVKKEIEKEFLAYEDETPEKDFCKGDFERRNKLMKLGLGMTASINSGVPILDIFPELAEKNEVDSQNFSFEGLFNEALHLGIIKVESNYSQNVVAFTRYKYDFNSWLQINKGWIIGDEIAYKSFLSIKVFTEFLIDQKEKQNAVEFYKTLTQVEAYEVYQKSVQTLRDRFRVKAVITESDFKSFPHFRGGEIISFEPDYNCSIEAFTLLKDYYAVCYLALEKYLFNEKYKAWNELTIRAEILILEEFFNKARNESVSEACKSFNKWGLDKDEFVYLRFKCGFYEHLEVKDYPMINSIGNKEAQIYGRYFLFYDFLKEQLNKELPVVHTEICSKSFKIDQIALIYVYEGNQITRENGNEIARKYNHNSGEKLFQRYTYYSSTANRKGKPIPYTSKKLKNKVELFESIFPQLSSKAQIRAKDEIQILKSFFDGDF